MRVYNLNDLKSSHIQYDKNPPKFIYFIILTIFIGLICIVILSNYTYKTEVVRATGILSSDNKTYIMAIKSGEIDTVYKKSGEYVEKGDVLFKINDSEIDNQIYAYQGKADLLYEYVNSYQTIINTLENINLEEELENPFTEGQFKKEYQSIIKQINESDSKNDTIDSYISQYERELFQYNYEYVGLTSQIEAYKNMKEEYMVTAETSGYINYTSEIKPGMVIDSSVIGTISLELSKDNAIVDLYVDTSAKSFIKENMDVEIVVSGLSQFTYGTLKGVVTYISNDSIQSDDNIFYRVSVKPKDITLKNKDKETLLSNGMIVEARIKYESLTWMKWALRKIGIIDR
jgi:membrane fusion protein, peptide pheromone/bacteriocin exporter